MKSISDCTFFVVWLLGLLFVSGVFFVIWRFLKKRIMMPYQGENLSKALMTVLPGIVSFNGTVLRNCSRFSIYPDKLVLRILSVPTVVITPEMMNEAPRFDDNTIVFDISYCGRMATVKLTTLDNRELAVMLNAWQQGNIEKIKTKIVYDPCHLKPVRRNLLIIKVAISGVLGCFAGALIGMSILRLIGLLPFIRIGDMEISGNLLGLLLAPLMGILSARSTYHAEMKKANTEQ